MSSQLNRLPRLALVPLYLFGAYWLLDTWLARKSYVFTLDEVGASARKGLGNGGTCEDKMRASVQYLQNSHPNAGVLDYDDGEWIFMRAGGWMGAFKLVYASLSEYVLVFGTAVNTSGHSGRYWAVVEDTLLCGNFRQWPEGKVESLVHFPGTTVVHERFEATGVQWEQGTWMVEHARGFIPSTLPFAFSDGIFSSQDFYALWRALVVYARLVTWNLVHGRV